MLRTADKRLVGVSLEDGFLLLNACLMDATGNVVLQVERGEMKVSTGNNLTIRGNRGTAVDI
jgi:hypothetical protein